MSVPVAVTAIGPIFISPLAFVVCVTSPVGELILNSAPCNFLLVFPCSTFTSFKLYSLSFGINLFSTVTVIVLPLTLILDPVWVLVITAFDIVYVLLDSVFVTCTFIGAVITFSYPSGACVSSIVIVSVPGVFIMIGPTLISPFELVVSVTVPFGLVILNVAPCNLFVVLPCSTFISFKLYEPSFGNVTSLLPLKAFGVLPNSTIGCTVLSPDLVQYVAVVIV